MKPLRPPIPFPKPEIPEVRSSFHTFTIFPNPLSGNHPSSTIFPQNPFSSR